MITAISLASAGTGVALLAWLSRAGAHRAAWQRHGLRTMGLGFILASAMLATTVTSPPRAMALTLLAAMAVAAAVLAGLGWRAQASNGSGPERLRERIAPRPNGQRVARVAWITLLAGPMSGLAAVATAAALNGLLTGWAPANRVGFVTVLTPLLWAVLAILATDPAPVRRRSLMVGSALAIAGLLAWLSVGAAN